MTDTIHVIPVQDTVEHEPADDCICGPATQLVECDDGAIGWMMLHHPLGGREHHTGTRLPSH